MTWRAKEIQVKQPPQHTGAGLFVEDRRDLKPVTVCPPTGVRFLECDFTSVWKNAAARPILASSETLCPPRPRHSPVGQKRFYRTGSTSLETRFSQCLMGNGSSSRFSLQPPSGGQNHGAPLAGQAHSAQPPGAVETSPGVSCPCLSYPLLNRQIMRNLC